jgi:tRNA A-37 threonylcarbamoyl transferase component Bud32
VSATRGEFRRHDRGPVRLVVAAPLEEAALALGLLEADAVERLQRRGQGGVGRGSNSVHSLPGHSERLHLRPFHHGGWLREITRDRLTSLERPLSELSVNARLAEAGAPVPRPALVVGRRNGPWRWNAAVGTLHEESCRDGDAFLAACPTDARITAAAGAVGVALRRLHDAGGRHADLHLGNLLLRERGSPPEALFVDLDRARIVSSVPARRRAAEIMRLYRSLLKRGHAKVVTPNRIARFFDAYCDDDEDLRERVRAAIRRESVRVALHRVGYRHR